MQQSEQLWVAEPIQAAPPLEGAGFVQVRLWMPVVPQTVAEHGPKGDQPPSMEPPSMGEGEEVQMGTLALQVPPH